LARCQPRRVSASIDIDLITLQFKLALREPGCPLCRLRRATPPAPLRIPLRDLASNSADDIAPIVARLEAAIASELRTCETALARALLPAWAEHRGYAEALVITHQRLLRIPDPAAGSAICPTALIWPRLPRWSSLCPF